MKISVVMPVYNAGKTLERAMVSILAQDFGDFEFNVIDDASTDDSVEIIRRLAREDSRIKPVFHRKNAGVSAALNEGLAVAAAPYVARMDADDESLPGRLGMQYVFIRNRPNVAVAGSFVYYMGTSPKLDRLFRVPVSSAEIAARIEHENCLYHPSVIMNRELVSRAGGYRQKFKNSEDYDLWLRLSRVHELANIPIPLLRYNFTVDGQTLGRKWEQLYYVYLAQVAYRNPDMPWTEIEQIAKEAHGRHDKDVFLHDVLLGTLSELLQLGRVDEARQLTERFGDDHLGPEKAAKILQRAANAIENPSSGKGVDWFEEFLAFKREQSLDEPACASKIS
jgi:glycosyltransferase involved in cell wall biosynthesis